jgi:hypothetical protein
MKPLALLASAVLPAIATTTTTIYIATPNAPAFAAPPSVMRPQPVMRQQAVAPLPGGLDQVLVVNDNNPELITGAGILLSTFPGSSRPHPAAHLDVPLNGRFDLFSHHVYAGKPESLDSTLWIGVVAQPSGKQPVTVRLLAGSTALSQSVDGIQPGAPFLPLPSLLQQGDPPIYSGPGSRVATELLLKQKNALLPNSWTLPAGVASPLLVLPMPVRGLDPLLNGRNLQLRLESNGPVSVATLAAFGDNSQPPAPEVWQKMLDGDLSPKEHAPSPRGSKGAMVYSRVSGVQVGSTWTGRITDPGKTTLSASLAPISWPISSLERGSLGTGQVQTASLKAAYPGTAWASHGNYGIEYNLALPLRNNSQQPVILQLAFESPLKSDAPAGGLRFNTTPSRAVMFRGTVEVSGLDNAEGKATGRESFHLVQRAGEPGPVLGTISLAAGAQRQVQVRLIYPADATPPQVLSLLPVKQSESSPVILP